MGLKKIFSPLFGHPSAHEVHIQSSQARNQIRAEVATSQGLNLCSGTAEMLLILSHHSGNSLWFFVLVVVVVVAVFMGFFGGFVFVFVFWPHLQHVEVPRPGVEPVPE